MSTTEENVESSGKEGTDGSSMTESGKQEAEAESEKKATTNEDSSPPEMNHSDDLSLSSTDNDDDSKTDSDNEETSGGDALVSAAVLKEEGNGHFQKGDWDNAARSYRRGANRLKKLSNGPDVDPQVTSLQLTLQTNLSMVLFKQEKYRASRDVASKALDLDKNHVKALYRRALACRKMGDYDLARTDLKAALLIDPNNIACKKELASIKKQVDLATLQQKSALAKAFASGGKSSFLYDDKEKEEQEKILEKQRKEKEKEKLKQERKQKWEDECVARMTRGEKPLSFDEWEKELEKEEQKRKKEAERQRRRARNEQKKNTAQSTNSVKDDDDDDDDQLTEQELASLRGYKKTKDGRTTSYFTREISDEERQRIGDMAPKKLDANVDTLAASVTPPSSLPATPLAESASRPSAWNQAGTWEEKDCSTWCRDSLSEHLKSSRTESSSGSFAKITKVEDLTGEGSVAIAGGKKRYIFDFHARLKYKIVKVDDDKNVVASGVVRLPDICSTHYDDEQLEVAFESSWTKSPPQQDLETCLEKRALLADGLRQNVQKWVQEFNLQF